MQTSPATATVLDTFTAHYIAAALQLCDEEIGTEHTIYSLPAQTLATMQADCAHFVKRAAYSMLLRKDGSSIAGSAEQSGTDFWLSRNGHGAGFFARPEIYGDYNAEQLQTLAATYGDADLYLGNDGQVYHSPA